MIVLSNTTDKIEIDLAGNVAANQLMVFVSWRDRTSTTFIAGRTVANSNNTTAVDISGSPGASTQRIIDYISVFNADTAISTVTIQLNANGTLYTLWKGDVAANGRLEYQEGSGFQATNPVPFGYTLAVQALTSSPTDAQTIYFGNRPIAPSTTAATNKIYIRKAGTLKIAEIYCYSGTAGTNEAWSIYVRVNNSTDYLIQTVSAAANERIFSNTGLSIPLSVGDYIEIKAVNPTWATNPLTTIFGGYVYIE